jgi:predicted MPP superfamily phosphohydrolase
VLGDYFAGHRFVTERVPHAARAAELARLTAPLGVHAILGNHDWWYDIAGVRKALADVRVPVMENEAVLFGEKGRRFWLAGLGD